MSTKWSHSTLSASDSESGGEPQSKKSKTTVELSDASGGEEQGRKSRSRSRSGSGSDSGTARSKSSSGGSRSSSRKSREGSAKSRSPGSRGNSSDSGTGGSRASSPDGSRKSDGSGPGSPPTKRRRSRSPSGSGSGSNNSRKGGSGGDGGGKGGNIYSSSDSSSQQSDASHNSNKEKRLKKSKDHKASSKLEKQFSNPDSEDEGEISSPRRAAPNKKKSAANKNKASSSEEEEQANWRDEFDDGLDDAYIGDEEDRRMLDSLTEREREEEFYRRAEKREELKKRFEISQKLKKQQKQREAGSSSDNDFRDDIGASERGSSEARSITDKFPSDPMSRKKGYEEKYGSKFSALSELKAKREEKERKEKMREERMKKGSKKDRKDDSDSESGSDYEKLGQKKKSGKKLKASDIYSSSSSDEGGDVRRKTSSSSSGSSSSQSDGESDTERQNSKKTVKKAINIETLEQLEKIRLSRFKLDKFVHLPIFKKTVVGCFVRIGIGNHDGKDVYRCCEIIDTCETGKVYNVMKTKTNVGLKLRHGKDTRIFRLQFVSNAPLSESEFDKWKKACIEGNTNLPTVSHIEQKQRDIKYALEYRFSTADVEKILASKKKFDTGPKNFAMRKADLTKRRDMAATNGEHDKYEEYKKELDELERKAEDLDKKRCSTISTISFINDRNRKNNISRAYLGIREEEKRKKIEGEVDDPFTRRKTKPKLGNTKSKGQPVEMTSELLKKLEEEKAAKLAAAAEAAKKTVEIKPTSLPKDEYGVKFGKRTVTSKQPKLDIFDAHNFDINIDVDEIQSNQPITPSISLKPVTASSTSTPAGPTKRSLKLDEWKRKRGIM